MAPSTEGQVSYPPNACQPGECSECINIMPLFNGTISAYLLVIVI